MEAFSLGWICGAALAQIILLYFIWDELKNIRRKM